MGRTGLLDRGYTAVPERATEPAPVAAIGDDSAISVAAIGDDSAAPVAAIGDDSATSDAASTAGEEDRGSGVPDRCPMSQ